MKLKAWTLSAVVVVGLYLGLKPIDEFSDCVQSHSPDVVAMSGCAWTVIDEHADPLIALFTVFLFTVTALLARYTFKLWVATSEMANEASETAARQYDQMQNAVREARRAAQAAQVSADATARMAQTIPTTERAHVYLSIWGVVEQITRNGTPVIQIKSTIKIVNHGRTPAMLKRLYIQGCFTGGDGVGNVADVRPHCIPPHVFLGSGESLSIDAPLYHLTRPIQDWANYQTGTGVAYYAGQLIYADIFGNEHVWPFCWLHNRTIEDGPFDWYEPIPNILIPEADRM